MKKIIISISVLVLMAAICGFSTFRVQRISHKMVSMLEQAENRCISGDFDNAYDIVSESREEWNSHECFLGTALRHTESDEIDILYPVLMTACLHEDPLEFSKLNRELIATIKNLSKMEIPYLFNIL